MSASTIAPVARGWVALVEGLPCRIVGLASPERWRLRRSNGQAFTLPLGHPAMAKIEAAVARKNDALRATPLDSA